jgi:hypothetical protein
MEQKPMDKLADRLKRDAETIDVEISGELDRRIDASLRATSPLREAPQQRPAVFWWASSLTGVAAALVLIAVLNAGSQRDVPPESPGTSPVAMNESPATPIIEWNAQSAMLTSPLRQELSDLQSDIDKARQKVREDIGL